MTREIINSGDNLLYVSRASTYDGTIVKNHFFGKSSISLWAILIICKLRYDRLRHLLFIYKLIFVFHLLIINYINSLYILMIII